MVSDTVEEAKKKRRNREGTTQQTRNATQGVIFGGVAHTHTQTKTDTQTYTHRHTLRPVLEQDCTCIRTDPCTSVDRPFPYIVRSIPACAKCGQRRHWSGLRRDDPLRGDARTMAAHAMLHRQIAHAGNRKVYTT